jgi:NAD(P)-dependent dehydrogenase (short-subunit alcohol dehydrogenase family)
MAISIVTGASSGIGRAVAARLVQLGHRVIGLDIVPPDEVLAGVEYVETDLSTESGLEAVLAALESLNITQINSIVHCAGIGQFSRLHETERAQWERILRVNLFGTIGLAQVLSPKVVDGGSIVFFGSGTVYKGPKELFAYVASKGGVIAFARSLAEELGERSITVNVVSPGITETPMIATMAHTVDANVATRSIKRKAIPEDIVGTVLYLISNHSRFVTGQAISVDGGSTKH